MASTHRPSTELPSKLLPKTAKFVSLKEHGSTFRTNLSFNARKIEPHEGQMWALAAYTPQSFERCSDEIVQAGGT